MAAKPGIWRLLFCYPSHLQPCTQVWFTLFLHLLVSVDSSQFLVKRLPGFHGSRLKLGPLKINFANSTFQKPMLQLNPYRWTKVASVLFLDQPAGSGFSYAKTPEAYITNDTASVTQAYHFLRKGYLLGNPLTDTFGDLNSRIPYAHRMALLSDTIYKSTKENCDGEYINVDLNNSLCIHDLQVVNKCLERIRKDQILEPYCESSNTLKSDLHRRDLSSLDVSSPPFPIQGCREDNYIYIYYWANSRDLQEALHVGEVFNDIEWVRCNKTMTLEIDKESASYTQNVQSSVGYHR